MTLPSSGQTGAAGAFRLRLRAADAASRRELQALSGQGSPFQSAGFVEAWMATRGAVNATTLAVLAVEREAAVTALLPLELFRLGPLRIARFPGETHANANAFLSAAPIEAAWLCASALAEAAATGGIRIDALDLRRVSDSRMLGADWRTAPAPEERFAVSLAGGIDAVLARGNAKRKRKKFRAQQRHFEAKGGYRFADLPAGSRAGALALFREQKRLRFAGLGLPDPFADRGIEAFLGRLFGGGGPAGARLYAVESEGAIKALMGGIVEGATFWGMFSSFADDEDASASPGELLLWHLVEALSGEGLAVLDLGPGEERYKRSWCDRVVAQQDGMLPLTAAGRLYVAGAGMGARLAASVKASDRLRGPVQRLRRLIRRR